jgi:hypothetical protein
LEFLDSIEECVLLDQVQVEFHFTGHVAENPAYKKTDPSSPLIRADSPECLAMINHLIADLPQGNQNSPPPPCCQGQWLRIIDKNNSVYSQGQIEPDGHFDITLTTKKNSDTTKGALEPIGYTSDSNSIPYPTKACPLSGPCYPENSSHVEQAFFSGPPFPDESKLPTCHPIIPDFFLGGP